MRPSLLHVPPRPDTTSQTGNGAPPATSIRISLLSVKKAMDLPSGDQKGLAAPSVPATSRSVCAIERPDPQPGLPAARSNICGGPAVGRQGEAADVVSEYESASVRRIDVETERGVLGGWLAKVRHGPAAERADHERSRAMRCQRRTGLTAARVPSGPGGCSIAHVRAAFKSRAV